MVRATNEFALISKLALVGEQPFAASPHGLHKDLDLVPIQPESPRALRVHHVLQRRQGSRFGGSEPELKVIVHEECPVHGNPVDAPWKLDPSRESSESCRRSVSIKCATELVVSTHEANGSKGVSLCNSMGQSVPGAEVLAVNGSSQGKVSILSSPSKSSLRQEVRNAIEDPIPMYQVKGLAQVPEETCEGPLGFASA